MKEQYFHEKLLEKAFGFQFLEWYAVCKNLLRMTQPDPSICDLKTLFGFNLIQTPKKPAKETKFSLLTKTYSNNLLYIYAKAEHKNFECIEFHSCISLSSQRWQVYLSCQQLCKSIGNAWFRLVCFALVCSVC